MKYITVTLNPAIDLSYTLSEPFEVGRLNRASRPCEISYSGKGINVSREFIRLGIDSKVLCLLGEEDAEKMTSALRGDHLNLFSVRTPGRIRRNVSAVGPDGRCVEINEPGGEIELEDVLRFFSLYDKVINEPGEKTVVISGSAPPGFRDDIYKRLVIAAKKAGAFVILDADGDLLEKGVEGGPDLITPNEKEISSLTGTELKGEGGELRLSALAQAAYVYEKCGVAVLCTLGENGSVFAGEEGRFICEAKSAEIKRFKGAGDFYLARYVYERIERGRDVPGAMKIASEETASYLEEE